tara:strand:- start:44 stop:724 length:681 start_codon:yes stop_codon:yes gene_type:complete
MGISLTIDQDLKGFDRFLNNYRDQLPFATSKAINDTASNKQGGDIKTALNKGTISAFQRPVKFTQNAFKVKRSTKRNLVAHIFAVDEVGKDRARYLRFGVKGGARPAKGYERFFSGLPNDGTVNAYFIPSQIKVDGFGNVTRANLKKVSAAVQNNKAFIGTPRNSSRPPGIYERDGNKLITRFVSVSTKPTYTGRFNIEAIAEKVIQRRFNEYFNKAMKKAIETRK